MAISLGEEPLTVASQRRTWRLQVECPQGADYTLQAFRELVRSVSGTVLSRDPNAHVVTRTLSQAAANQVTLASEKTITVAEMAEALALFIDQWESADLA